MKYVVESFNYKLNTLTGIVPQKYILRDLKEQTESVDYVGYLYSHEKKEVVFILPKVFLKSNNLFLGILDVYDLLNNNEKMNYLLSQQNIKISLFDISLKLYLALHKYKTKYQSISVSEEKLYLITSSTGNLSFSFIDIYLSLINFYNKHQNLFSFIIKNSNSNTKRINWKKTITKKVPLIDKNNGPIYREVMSFNKVINYEEKLLVLFYSLLNYFKEQFNFKFKQEINYSLLQKREIKKLIDYTGVRYLNQIKGNYFRHEFKTLWQLLFLFFSKTFKGKTNNNKDEVLICSNFNLIFEDMIDNLLGREQDIPQYYKDQLDGKIVDHIFKYDDLFMDKKIYYIGDSKYYKEANRIGDLSIEKQLTYAYNAIQYSINLLLNNELNKELKYRDPLTEGYNITPNFFIRGIVENDLNWDSTFKDLNNNHLSKHFYNRLFDRDTLFVKEFSINLLFVLNSYIEKKKENIGKVRNHLRRYIRSSFIEYLNDTYLFFSIKINDPSETNNIFYILRGKIYRLENGVLILAIEKKQKNLEQDLEFIKTKVTLTSYSLK